MNNKTESVSSSEMERNSSFEQKLYIEIPITFQLSEEKLKNVLQKYRKQLGNRHSWKIPLGILIPLIFTMMTSSFNNFIGINAHYIKFAWLIITSLIFLWLIISIILSLRPVSIDKIIKDLKKDLHETRIIGGLKPKGIIKSNDRTIIQKDKLQAFKSSEKYQIKSELGSKEEFNYKIIKAVHGAGFSNYQGIYNNLKSDVSFEVKEKDSICIIVALYWSSDRGTLLPSEQLDKYIKKSEEYGISYIIASNALGLTQKANEILNDFNRRFKRPRLWTILGPAQTDYTQEIKNIASKISLIKNGSI